MITGLINSYRPTGASWFVSRDFLLPAAELFVPVLDHMDRRRFRFLAFRCIHQHEATVGGDVVGGVSLVSRSSAQFFGVVKISSTRLSADISSRARTCLLKECWSGVSIVMANRTA